MNLIGTSAWNEYKRLIGKDAADTFAQKPITWLRKVSSLKQFGEDIDANSNFDVIILKGLLNSNYMRTWPITSVQDEGELDKQSTQLFLSIPYLQEQGYWDDNLKQFKYKPDYDRFIIDGLYYKPFGDTPVAQTDIAELWFTIVLKREEKSNT